MTTCYAEQDPSFLPALRLITSITNSYPATISTTFDHDFSSGIIVRIQIPIACGMEQLNNYTGEITVIGPTTFTLDVDTTRYALFAIPAIPFPVWSNTCATVVPIGEVNSKLDEAVRNVL
jgi:hypothetical protein